MIAVSRFFDLSMAPMMPEFSFHQLGGPIWSDPIHDRTFVQELLADISACPPDMYTTRNRIKGLLTLVSEVSVGSARQPFEIPTGFHGFYISFNFRRRGRGSCSQQLFETQDYFSSSVQQLCGSLHEEYWLHLAGLACRTLVRVALFLHRNFLMHLSTMSCRVSVPPCTVKHQKCWLYGWYTPMIGSYIPLGQFN